VGSISWLSTAHHYNGWGSYTLCIMESPWLRCSFSTVQFSWNFSSSLGHFSFSGRTLLHGVITPGGHTVTQSDTSQSIRTNCEFSQQCNAAAHLSSQPGYECASVTGYLKPGPSTQLLEENQVSITACSRIGLQVSSREAKKGKNQGLSNA
jgi:hypothetical protein